MSRFGHLEFGENEQESARGAGPGLKGEEHYRAAAGKAFEDGEFELALRLYGKILEYNPAQVAAWSGQVRMLIELGEFEEASRWADSALEKFPSDPELLSGKAVALARCGDLEAALVFSDASLGEGGDVPYAWLARGDVLLARKESRADYCFEKALGLASGDWFMHWLAARVRAFYQQFSHALKLLRRAVELNPTHFVVWFELGRCQEALGLVGPAQFAYEQASQLNPACLARQARVRLDRAGMGERVRAWWRRLFST